MSPVPPNVLIDLKNTGHWHLEGAFFEARFSPIVNISLRLTKIYIVDHVNNDCVSLYIQEHAPL